MPPCQQIVNAWKADRTVAAVVLSEKLGRLAASLAGWDSARVAQDDVVWKPPGSGPVAYHQDSAYISRQFIPVSAFGVTAVVEVLAAPARGMCVVYYICTCVSELIC